MYPPFFSFAVVLFALTFAITSDPLVLQAHKALPC
jgi:hypothetical protein